MITIIEGTDAVGKTTYAKQLSEQTNAIYLHRGAPVETNWAKEYFWSLDPMKNYVLDRWHVGEMIWPKYFNRESLFETRAQFNMCNLMLSTIETKIIIVKRDAQQILDVLKERNEYTEKVLETTLSAQHDFIAIADSIQYVPVNIVNTEDLSCI